MFCRIPRSPGAKPVDRVVRTLKFQRHGNYEIWKICRAQSSSVLYLYWVRSYEGELKGIESFHTVNKQTILFTRSLIPFHFVAVLISFFGWKEKLNLLPRRLNWVSSTECSFVFISMRITNAHFPEGNEIVTTAG